MCKTGTMIIKQDYNWDCEEPPASVIVEGMSNSEILQKFPSEIRHLIAELWLNGNIGLCDGNIKIISLQNLWLDEGDNCFYADSFTLSIPYAGSSLLWEIIFCRDDVAFTVDIMVDDESFQHSLKQNKNLDWNPHNSNSLINLIKEYITLYKQHNINILSENEMYSRYNFEYSSLVGETGVTADQVEVLVAAGDVVHFLISIPVDFSNLPLYLQENEENFENLREHNAILLVVYHRLDGSKIQPTLQLSPYGERVLGAGWQKSIPPFPPVEGCLMDYVPEVRKTLLDKIEQIITNFKLKNEYIMQILARYGCNIIEYDNVTFSKITLLFVINNFSYLLIISIGNKFPQEKPIFILRSVFHMTCTSKPYMETLNDYPYSPRWTPDEMISRSLDYTVDKIPLFQKASVANSVDI